MQCPEGSHVVVLSHCHGDCCPADDGGSGGESCRAGGAGGAAGDAAVECWLI
jgi:hypothetical protein